MSTPSPVPAVRLVVLGQPAARLLRDLTLIHPVAAVYRNGVPPAADGLAADLVVLCGSEPAADAALLAGGPGVPRLLAVLRPTDAHRVATALRAGVTSVLIDGDFTGAELASAVRATLRGQSQLSPQALTALVAQLRPRSLTDPLSGRERQIMALLATGESNDTIAGRLFLAEKTVRNHVSRIYRKLGVHGRAEAIVRWHTHREPARPA